MMPRLHGGLPAALALAWAVAGCVELPAPAIPPVEPPVAPAPRPSGESVAIRAHLARVQASYLEQGRLRTDTAPMDAPFTARQLAENFLRIAFYDEFTEVNGRLTARRSESRLRRWDIPIRMQITFGPTVPPGQQLADRNEIAHFVRRLSLLTGLPISTTDRSAAANFHVLVLAEDERRAAGPLLKELSPQMDPVALRSITEMPRTTYCTVVALSPPASDAYIQAVAVIRSEHPERLRLSCFHEELAQAMGLANDSPAARPSIFNDDEEFALLTSQDEMMLRILYDRRLRPGMTESEARPIVETIAAELIGGES